MIGYPKYTFVVPAHFQPSPKPKPVKRRRIKIDEARDAAWGRWRKILVGFGVSPGALRGKGAPCLRCGGTDGFRFQSGDGNGKFSCSMGGPEPVMGDGFHALQHLYGIEHRRAEDIVAGWLTRNLDTLRAAEVTAASPEDSECTS